MIFGATRNPDLTWTTALLLDTTFAIPSFGEGFDKELYVVDYSGRLLAIDDPSSPVIDSISPSFGASNGGDQVTITVEPFKDGRPYGRIIGAVLADGKILGPATSPPSTAGAPPQP